MTRRRPTCCTATSEWFDWIGRVVWDLTNQSLHLSERPELKGALSAVG